jgi:hypothetical protein
MQAGWPQACRKTLPTVWNSEGERFCLALATACTEASHAQAWLRREMATGQQVALGVCPADFSCATRPVICCSVVAVTFPPVAELRAEMYEAQAV